MARKEKAAELLRQGLPPSEIARQMHTTPAEVMQYLALMIGEGELRRSDVAFALPRDLRVAIEQAIEKSNSLSSWVIARELKARGHNASRVDIGVYLRYRRARVVLGDMYELLRTVEVRLHKFIKEAFIAEFGEENWWRSGVPDNIRAECAALREKDPEPADEPYSYTHLISLREILDKRWSVLNKYIPERLLNQKKDLLERLIKLNRIRNSVMHPVRNPVLTEEDFEFVRDFEADFADLKVNIRTTAKDSAPMVETTVEEPAPAELVTKLAPTREDNPAPEEAATPEEAGDSRQPSPVAKAS